MTSAIRPVGPTTDLLAKHAPRRSTLVRKREGDEITEPSSPSKRSKVTFDSNVEVQVVEEWGKSPAVIQETVRRAIQKHTVGDSASYERVKAVFVPAKIDQDGASPVAVRNYTAALLSNASLLNKFCADLVNTVLESNWLERSEDYVQLFTQFLANLVSAQGVHLPNVLRMLAENLTASKTSTMTGHSLSVNQYNRSFITKQNIHNTWYFSLYDLWACSQDAAISSADHTLGLPHPSLYPNTWISPSQ